MYNNPPMIKHPVSRAGSKEFSAISKKIKLPLKGRDLPSNARQTHPKFMAGMSSWVLGWLR